jgi:hypothetical protein
MITDDPKDPSTSDGDVNNAQSEYTSDTSPDENIEAPPSVWLTEGFEFPSTPPAEDE